MFKKVLLFSILFSIGAIVAVALGSDKWSFLEIQSKILATGFWAPLIFMLTYAIATALILPSTVLNLTGGAIFGLLWGMIWTSLAAIGSAVFSFWITRSWLRTWIQTRFSRQYQGIDDEICQSGLTYLFAVRLLPVIPYGVISYSAGLTSVSFRDYLMGTIPGTVLGLLPFVMLGDSGVTALTTGQVWNVILPLTLIGLLVIGTTWYQHKKK